MPVSEPPGLQRRVHDAMEALFPGSTRVPQADPDAHERGYAPSARRRRGRMGQRRQIAGVVSCSSVTENASVQDLFTDSCGQPNHQRGDDHGRPAVTRHALQQHLCYPSRVLPNLGALLTTSMGSQHFGSFEYLGLCRVLAEGSLRSGGMA